MTVTRGGHVLRPVRGMDKALLLEVRRHIIGVRVEAVEVRHWRIVECVSGHGVLLLPLNGLMFGIKNQLTCVILSEAKNLVVRVSAGVGRTPRGHDRDEILRFAQNDKSKIALASDHCTLSMYRSQVFDTPSLIIFNVFCHIVAATTPIASLPSIVMMRSPDWRSCSISSR